MDVSSPHSQSQYAAIGGGNGPVAYQPAPVHYGTPAAQFAYQQQQQPQVYVHASQPQPLFVQPQPQYVQQQPQQLQPQFVYGAPVVPPPYHAQYQPEAPSAPLFSPSSLAGSEASPHHQLGGSTAAKLMAASTTTGLRDKWWLLLFALHIVFVIVVEIVFGQRWAKGVYAISRSSGTTITTDSLGQQLLSMWAVAAIVGSLFAALCYRLTLRLQGKVVVLSVVSSVLLGGVTMISCFVKGYTTWAVALLMWTVFLSIWAVVVRDRIPLAEATLAASCRSLADSPGPILVSYGIAVISILWTVNWLFSVLVIFIAAIAADSNGSDTTFENACLWILLVSYFWCSQVWRSVVHFTAAGTVSSWWLVAELERPTWGAFKRSVTTSFGTICIGSLVTGIVEFVAGILRFNRCCCWCLADLLNRGVRYYNSYAFVLAAMYGYSYFESAKAVHQLMAASFWDLLISNSLTGVVFTLINMMSGYIAGAVTITWLTIAMPDLTPAGMPQQSNYYVWVLALVAPALSFWTAYQMSSLFTAVLNSAVSTTLVVWAEDPQAMRRNRPEHFDRIASAAALKFPEQYGSAFPALAAQQQQQQQQQPMQYQPPAAGGYQQPQHNLYVHHPY